ncbi:hypothetical protein JD844_029162 [Phrynosoma platyrhinos]|uniref:Serine/threonine-protein phosphatase 6 regulatory subunit 2 n=1 Tax=Phrynosoma platyrhinos TaxID=52577 RepID=A0ABQ7SIV0_PHRPL|nr:hypothetical protein JD844_029162 [Phrynosoma platyrhinos]
MSLCAHSVEGLVDSFSQGFARSYTVNSGILCGIEPRLSDFHQLLLHPPKTRAILTTIGVLEEPLGNARLHGARLIGALLHTNTPSINQELCRLNTMDLLLDLFFKYTWNNFLHFQVELCIVAILAHSEPESQPTAGNTENNGMEGIPAPGDSDLPKNGHPENIMVTHLFQKCCLVQRILDAWETNDRIQAEGGMRRGNMGHLTRIANTIVQNMDKGPMQTQISEFVKGLPEDCRGRWESFVEETLTEANRRNTVDLVSTHHLHSSSEDEDAEAAFSSELSLQQAFSEYQIQQMTASFVDQFGFNDEEFAEPDDNIKPKPAARKQAFARQGPHLCTAIAAMPALPYGLLSVPSSAPYDRIAEINFNIVADDDSPSASLFEACCSERIQQFDDNEEEEDIWEEKERSYEAQVKSRTRSPEPGEEEAEEEVGSPPDGNGSHPEDKSIDPSLEGTGRSGDPAQVFAGSSWTTVFEPVSSKPPASCVAMDIGSSVWDSASLDPKTPEERGWAKFTDFQPFCCSEAGPRCSSPADMENSDSEGGLKLSQEENNLSAASPCAWNVCVARKAPLVASDSSSSGGSESEEEEEKADDVVTGTISTGSSQEAVKLTVDTRNNKAVFISSSSGGELVMDKMTSLLEHRPVKAPDSSTALTYRSRPNSAATSTISEAKSNRGTVAVAVPLLCSARDPGRDASGQSRHLQEEEEAAAMGAKQRPKGPLPEEGAASAPSGQQGLTS